MYRVDFSKLENSIHLNITIVWQLELFVNNLLERKIYNEEKNTLFQML